MLDQCDDQAGHGERECDRGNTLYGPDRPEGEHRTPGRGGLPEQSWVKRTHQPGAPAPVAGITLLVDGMW